MRGCLWIKSWLGTAENSYFNILHCSPCTPLAVSLVVEMRQTASNVTEAEFFLKKHFEVLPVGM